MKAANLALIQDGVVSDEFNLKKAKNAYINKMINFAKELGKQIM